MLVRFRTKHSKCFERNKNIRIVTISRALDFTTIFFHLDGFFVNIFVFRFGKRNNQGATLLTAS